MLRTLHTRIWKIDNSAIFVQKFVPMKNISLFMIALFGPNIFLSKFLSTNKLGQQIQCRVRNNRISKLFGQYFITNFLSRINTCIVPKFNHINYVIIPSVEYRTRISYTIFLLPTTSCFLK